jgi:hypothetical protein
MGETNESQLGTYVALTLVVSITVLAGIAVYPLIAGEKENTERGMVWTENWICKEEPNATTAGASAQGIVLTSGTAGVAVDRDEQNESVTFRIVTRDTNVDHLYVVGDHRYENFPVVCDDKITLSGDELGEKGELQLIGILGEIERSEMEVKRENGTRVLTKAPHNLSGVSASVIQAVEYDFTED